MLTATPPEVQEDEIQVDEAEKDSLLLRMSPTRVKENRKAQDCKGFNYIQLIVGMIIFVALSRIVGPPAFRMVTTARSTALEANIQTAAETVRNVLALDPAKRGDPPGGVPTAGFLAALTTDAPFNWNGTWALATDDDSDTIRVQFIDLNAPTTLVAPVAAGGTTGGASAPQVAWLLNDWDAVRIQARNQDGAWACALVVLKPNTANLDVLGGTPAGTDGLIAASGAIADTTVANDQTTVELANAHLRGIWYDSGDTYLQTGTAPAARLDGIDHCSPVVYNSTASSQTAPLPSSASEWTIGTAVLSRGI